MSKLKPRFICMTSGGLAMLGIYLAVANLLLLSILIGVWPATRLAQLAGELRLFVITTVSAGLGSAFFALISFIELYLKRRLFRRHTVWYLLLPFTGMVTGLFVYLVLRVGLLKLHSQIDALNPLAVVLLSVFAGFWCRRTLGRVKRFADKWLSAEAPQGATRR